jgi:hypothetical protein
MNPPNQHVVTFTRCDVEVLVVRFEPWTSPLYFNALATNSSHITCMDEGVKHIILEAGIHLLM